MWRRLEWEVENWESHNKTPLQIIIFTFHLQGLFEWLSSTYVILVSIQLVTGSSTMSSSSLHARRKFTLSTCNEFPYSHRQVPQGVELGPRACAARQKLRRDFLYERCVLTSIHLGTTRGTYRPQSTAVVTQNRGWHLKSSRYQSAWKRSRSWKCW